MSGVGASNVVMMEKQLRAVHPRVLSRARHLLLIVTGDVDLPLTCPALSCSVPLCVAGLQRTICVCGVLSQPCQVPSVFGVVRS